MLSISESYLRKWCLELEKHEYTFIKVRDPKSNREYRTFTSKDIKALKQFQTLMKDARYNKADAAKTVAITINNENWNAKTTLICYVNCCVRNANKYQKNSNP
ncbi:hypothetical protein [Bacillus cereus group sp. RP32]|uniref:hypothetical protein n=1 Tax=Bacillus cereus group sp. RP32 TaxID=3040258 RepID=UPI003391430E